MRGRMTRAALVGLLVLLSWSRIAPAQEAKEAAVQTVPITPPARVPIAFDRLHDYPELIAQFRRIAEAYPELVTLRSVGKSVEGRDLWCVVVNNPRTGADGSKAALYMDGNIHGNEVQAGEVGLYLVWYLTENYQRNANIRALVDARAFYIIPTVNPDGRARWFNEPNTTHSSRSGMAPVDDDRDGVADEDGYDDLDGDGQITQMRRKSPTGDYRLSPEDPRLLVRIEPGDEFRGDRYELIGSEGLDNDSDGRINEDPPGGYDMNRNWPSDWQPPHVQNGAGDFPLCWPETRAVADFLLEHPNVAGVLALHNAGGMFLRGPGHPSRASQYSQEDERVMAALGATGERLVPFYRSLVTHKDLYGVRGGFTDWTFEHLGIYSFVVELWNNAQLLGRPEGSGTSLQRAIGGDDQAAQLFANDRLLFGSNFVEWAPFDHPTYGPIEIGGFVRQSQRIPPPFLIEEMCHRNAAFALYHADQMPLLEWGDLTVEALGSGTFAVTAAVRNRRIIPTRTDQAARRRIGLPDEFRIEGDQVEVLAGGVVTDRDRGTVQLVEEGPARIPLERGVRGRDEVRVRWFVRGAGSLTTTFVSQKGGTLRREVPLGQN